MGVSICGFWMFPEESQQPQMISQAQAVTKTRGLEDPLAWTQEGLSGSSEAAPALDLQSDTSTCWCPRGGQLGGSARGSALTLGVQG